MKLIIGLFLTVLVSSLSQDTDAVQVSLTDDESSATIDTVDSIESTDEEVNMNLEGMWELNMEESGSAEDSTVDEIVIVDLDEELRDLQDIYEDMEDFETVTIDGIVYTKDEVAQMIVDLEAEIAASELSEAALDVDILYFFREEPGNLMDYDQAMAAAAYLVSLMDDEDVVAIDGIQYTKADIEALMAESEKEKNDAILDAAVEYLDSLVLEDTEDAYEDYIDALEYVLSWIDDEAAIKLDDGVNEVVDLEEKLAAAYVSLGELDDLNDLEDEIADIEEQFLKENTVIDDYEDEIEEIEEVLALTTDTVQILDVAYSNEDLLAVIDEDNAGIQDLEVLAMVEEIELLFIDQEEELRLSLVDFEEGMVLIEELIAVMEPDDIVYLEGDPYTEDELQELVDTAKKYNNSQNLLSAITDVEKNVFSDPPTAEEIEDEIALLNEVLKYMDDDGQIAVIDEISYNADEIQELIVELEAELAIAINNEALENELGDVQFLLDMFEGTVTADDLDLLIEELGELEVEMEDGDLISTEDGEILDAEDIDIIIEDTTGLIDEVPSDGELVIADDQSVNQLSGAFLA